MCVGDGLMPLGVEVVVGRRVCWWMGYMEDWGGLVVGDGRVMFNLFCCDWPRYG